MDVDALAGLAIAAGVNDESPSPGPEPLVPLHGAYVGKHVGKPPGMNEALAKAML